MNELSRYAKRPYAFIFWFVRRCWISHAAILAIVTAAVACSVSTQYGVKSLVDSLSEGPGKGAAWPAFILLTALIASDNILWRLAAWFANYSFVDVSGDLRRHLFRYVTGHAPSYFTDRQPGTLASRVSAAATAVFATENMFVWNVLPPCAATIVAIGFVTMISAPMAGALALMAGVVTTAMFKIAAAGRPLHHDFANKTAAVDGELVDVIGNMPLVRAFCGLGLEHERFDATVDREMKARRSSLFYLEKLRLGHAFVTVVLTIGLLGWAVVLWERGEVSTGGVVMACTLGLSVLHATRDLAVALVDVTQHIARLAEAVETLLVPHQLRDHPEATPIAGTRSSIAFENICFRYPDGRRVFDNLDLKLSPGQRVGLVGPSGGGKSSLFALLQRHYDPQAGRILLDGHDISRITLQSLREAIAVVPQDISLFHRSVMENIRYGRRDATDDDVMEAAGAARCLEFIQALPEGFGTIVGDRGVKLSGGQRQRIAIARAFLKDAPFLLLDEATSALDGESEAAVQDALDVLMRGRTVIAIAHRLSTVRNFERIIVLQEGRVVQDGPPDHLMRLDGFYRDLVNHEIRLLEKRAA